MKLGQKRLPHQAICDEQPFHLGRGVSADTPIDVCCICGFLRDPPGLSPEEALWVTQCAYCQKHGVNLSDCALTHTYCPVCFMKVQDRVRVYHEEMAHHPGREESIVH